MIQALFCDYGTKDKVHNLPLDRLTDKKESKSDYQTHDYCSLITRLKFKPHS